MTTWTELLADLRTDLQDTGGTPRWSDRLLFVYARDAVRDYSTWFPQRNDRVALTLSGGKYALPSNFIEEIFVECPLGTFLEKRRERPGVRSLPQSRLVWYTIVGLYLYTNVSTTEQVYLTYNGTHPVPVSETPPAPGEDEFEYTIPDSDMELIRLYVKAKCYEQMRSRQASLDRFKVSSGARDDNPITPEVADLMSAYRTGIAQRIRGSAVMLYRVGRFK